MLALQALHDAASSRIVELAQSLHDAALLGEPSMPRNSATKRGIETRIFELG